MTKRITIAPILQVVADSDTGRNTLKCLDGSDVSAVLRDFKPGEIVHVIKEADFNRVVIKKEPTITDAEFEQLIEQYAKKAQSYFH